MPCSSGDNLYLFSIAWAGELGFYRKSLEGSQVTPEKVILNYRELCPDIERGS